MKELNNEVPNFDFFGELGERIKNYIRVEVKRKIEEFFEDYEQLKKHQQSTINSNELCKFIYLRSHFTSGYKGYT